MAPESNTPNTTAPIRQNVAVPKPDAGANVTIDSSAGGQLQLGFDPSVATPTRSGNDLSFDVEGGGKITVKDFFAVGDESLPSLRLPDGTVVASTDFFSGSGLDMTTAAGPGGGAGAAGSGSGEYADDAGNLIAGIDRFGKLGTDFWGRGSEVPDPWIGGETPGGDFGFDVQTGLGDGMFKAGAYEDARPYQHQHVDGGQQVPGQIYFDFTPTGTTTVTWITLSGFDPGTRIFVGDQEVFPDDQGRYQFTEDMFNTNINDSSHSGVYIIPPTNSDHDMTINARVDLITAGGRTGAATGTFTLVVDAVADKPNIIEPSLHIDADGYNGSMTVDESDKTQKYEDGWAKDSFDKTSGGTPDASHVDLTVKFNASLTFGDFGDGSEHHYALVEVPSNANIANKNFEAGTWTFKAGTASEGLTYQDPPVVIRYVNGVAYDTEADARAHGWTDGDAEKTFFRFEVDNGYLQQHLDPQDPSKATINVNFEMEGKGSNITGDVTFKLDAGAQAKEVPGASGELDLDNNNSYTWVTDGDSGHTVPLDVDTVDSRLVLKAGWVAEGNNPNKNLASGSQSADWTDQAYENDLDNNQKPDAAANTAKGAPLSLSIDGGDPASAEHITGASFSFDSADAILRLAGVEIANGSQVAVGGVTYTFTVSTAGGETTVSIAVSGPNAGGVTNLDALDLTFVPKNYYEDADIQFKYSVDVESSSGAKAHYSGESSVVVDAVADIAEDITGSLDKSLETGIGAGVVVHTSDESFKDDAGHFKSGTFDQYKVDLDADGNTLAGNTTEPDFHNTKGWEADVFKLDYSDVNYTINLKVSATFPDTDGSEAHYILVENPGGAWTLGTLPAGYELVGTYTGSDNQTYFQIQVMGDNPSYVNGVVNLPISMSRKGIAGDDTVEIKTGSFVEEMLKGDSHTTHGTEKSGREYDLGNNTAEFLGGSKLTYTIDVLNSKLSVNTGWASEGGMDGKHQYTAEQIAANPALGNLYALSNSNAYAGSTNDGKAPITFTLSDAVPAGSETFTTITFTLSAAEAARGTIVDASGNALSSTVNSDNSVTYTLSNVNAATATVYFAPTKGDFSYEDVHMDYSATVKNASGSTYIFNGSSQVVIDAVADKATVSIANDGSQVDYPHMTDPKTGNDVEQPAAKPGDTVTVHGTVTFPDVSGGEKHTILIDAGGTTANKHVTTGFTIEGANGVKLSYSFTTGKWTDAGGNEVSGLAAPVKVGNYYEVPADNFAGNGVADGDKLASFKVDIDVKMPTADSSVFDYSINFGGRADVADVPEGASGGAAGGSASDNYEFDKNNNTSTTTGSVKVDIQVVDTKSITMSVGSAYENADRDAHLDQAHATAKYPNAQGFVARADMLDGSGQFKAEFLAQVKADSAKIDFTAPTGANEVINGLSVSFDCLTDGAGNFVQTTGNFMYGDKLIPLDFDGTVNGDHVICSYNPATGHVTLTIIPADGVYETAGQNLYFVPGESFRSDDIPLDFAAVVRDNASGYTKGFSSESGEAAQDMMEDLTDKMNLPTDANHMSQSIGGQDTSKPIDNTVEVDAVAQQAGLSVDASDVHSSYGDQYNSVVPGTVAKVTLDIDLRGDVLDKTESHFLYVKVPDSFAVDKFTVTYLGVDGQMHTVTIDGSTMGLQRVDTSTGATGGVYFSWSFGNLVHSPANGDMDVDLYIKTPGGVSGKASFEAGVRSQEEWYKIQNQPTDKWEGELNNNQANTWSKFEIPFSTCKQPGLSVSGFTVENSNIDAHMGTEGQAPWSDAPYNAKNGVENWDVQLNFDMNDGNDKLTGFSLSLQSGSAALGDLVVYASDGTTVLFRGDAINSLDELKAIFGITGDMSNIPGKIVFEPSATSFSGVDPKIDYTIQMQDTASGQPKAISNVPYTDAFDGTAKGANAGDLTITADSVAQRPEDLHFEADSGAAAGGVLHEGEARTVTVEATFGDLDGSTQHYILIEALGGWGVKVGGTVYGPDDLVTLEQDGKTYYRIPVSPIAGTGEGHPGDMNYGKASVTVDLVAPKGRMFLGDYDMEVKAGSTDKSEGGEITFHNNTAIIGGDGLSGKVTREGGGGRWYFEQDAPLYEDNMPNQHTGDYTTTASGHIDVAGPAGGTIQIVVSTVNGQPVLDISGPGVTYNSATGTYSINITVNGNTGVDVKLSDAYIQNSDADLNFKSVTLVEPNGGGTHSLGGDSLKVLVDAVADQTAATGHSDHYTGAATDHIGGNDAQYIGTDGVAGTKGESGSDSVAHFEVEAKFGDIDGSEHHYILVEKTPAWGAPSGTAEVYIDGKTYYMFDVTAQANAGQTKFDIALTYQGGAGTGDDIFGSNAKGVTSYDLRFGTMSREHPVDGEFRIDNNTAINIDGEITLQYSPIDSTGGMSISQTVVDEWGGNNAMQAVTLGITGIATDKSDVLADLQINYTANAGQLYLVDGSGMKIAVATGFTGFTADQLAKLSSGAYKFSFEPNRFSHQDVNFSWSGTVKDTVSGVSETIDGSQKLVIDAVADHSDNTYATDYGAGHTAALSGAAMTVTVTADFRDNVNTSEEHWAVLEQKDLRYSVTEVKIYNTNGDLVGTYGPADIVTKFDEAGKPYFAVKMPDQGDYKVEFKVSTPQLDKDTSLSLDAGTIVIDTTKNGSDVEPDYGDNWTKDTKPVTIETAVVESTTIKVTAESATMSEDSGKMKINFSVPDTATTHDSIKDVTIKVPTGGKLIVDGAEYSSSSVKITADQLDKVYFEPGKNWSGTVNLDITAGTLIDNASGATKAATGLTDGSFTVQGVADAPVAGSVDATNNGEVAGTHNVTVTLTAQYADIDGSENHFFVVKVPAGLTLNGSYTALTNAEKLAMGLEASATWYKVNANSNTTADASATVSFKVSADYDPSNELEYAAAAQEKNGYASGKQYAASDVQTVTIPDIPNTAPMGVEAEVTAILSAAAAMQGTLDVAAMFTDTEHDVVTPLAVSFGSGSAVTLDPSGSVTVDGDHGTLTVTGDGAGQFSYDYALHPGANVNTTDHDSFNFSGKDSYGADATSLGKLTFEFDEHHMVGQTTSGTLSAAMETHGVVMHGGDSAEVITGSGHDDIIYGGAGNDDIRGGAGNDIIYTGSGDNRIHGGAGDDVMHSGSGNNTFLWLAEDFGNAGAAAEDTIHDFKLNHDRIDLTDLFGENASIDTLLDNAAVDSVSRTVTFSSGGTTLEAEFKSASELMLTLKDDQGNEVQTIDVHAAEGAHFYEGSAGDSLSEGAMRLIVEQIIKDNN